jgi:hypothetical protein
VVAVLQTSATFWQPLTMAAISTTFSGSSAQPVTIMRIETKHARAKVL